MHTAEDYDAVDDEKSKAARERVLSAIRIGINEQRALIEYCVKNIPRDRYVAPSSMNFDTESGPHINSQARANQSRLVVEYAMAAGATETKFIHKHALGQLCDYAGLPRVYAHKLDEGSTDTWKRQLLAHNFNQLFARQTFTNRLKKPATFLHRIVGDELRAVLTQSYNRHLLSATMLQPFLAAIEQVGVKPAKATITDMRVHLQCYLPYVFEPIPGEYIALGVSWSNSDFGQGKLKISHTIMRLNGEGSLVTEDAFSRMHLGSVVEETDLTLDDNVARKELETVAAATQSAVNEVMKPTQVKRVLTAIAAAHAAKYRWDDLKNGLSKFLTKKDLATVEDLIKTEIRELPPAGFDANGQPLLSGWWASAVLAHLAEKTVDGTQSMQLKQAAGTFLKLPDETK